MPRCDKTTGLEVHHKRRDGGNELNNAEVLCQECHENTGTYGTPGGSPLDFSEETKKDALRRADNQCECIKDNCH